MGVGYLVRAARAPSAGLAMVGVFWGGFAGLMPDIKAQAGASDAAFGLIMMLSAAGAIVAMALAPRLYERAGRATLPVVGLALVVAFHYPIFATGLWRLSLAVLAMGASVGMLDITANMRASAIEAAENASFMNFCHAMFSFAFGLSALGVGLLREAGQGPAGILPWLAAVAFVVGLLTLERERDWHPTEAPEEGATARPTGTYWRVVILTAVVLFCSFVGENAIEAWSALHIERTLGADVGFGSFGPGVMGLVMGFSRLGGQAVAEHVGERALVTFSAVLGATGAVLIAAAWSPNVVLGGVAVAAMGMAVVVPSANTVLGRRVSGYLRGVALSRAWMIGMTGFFVGPSVMGLVAENFGLRVSYLVIAGIIAVIVPTIAVLGRIPRVTGARRLDAP